VGLTSKPPAAFGAATADASDEEKDDGSDDDSPSGIRSPRDEEVKDKRFYEQAVNTGEENETSIFLQRAKLYSFSAVPPSTEKKWVERGVGNLKLNVKLPPEDEPEDGEDAEAVKKPQKKKARFVMRAEGSHRVVLNSPVQKGSKFGEETGERPKGQKFYFLGQPEGSDRLETMILKASRFPTSCIRQCLLTCDIVEDRKCPAALGSSAKHPEGDLILSRSQSQCGTVRTR
jgi:Ran-binding protein 3